MNFQLKYLRRLVSAPRQFLSVCCSVALSLFLVATTVAEPVKVNGPFTVKQSVSAKLQVDVTNVNNTLSLMRTTVPVGQATGYDSREVYVYSYESKYDTSTELEQSNGLSFETGYEMNADVYVTVNGNWLEFEIDELTYAEMQGQQSDLSSKKGKMGAWGQTGLVDDLPTVRGWRSEDGEITSLSSPKGADPGALALMHGIIADFSFVALDQSSYTASETKRSGVTQQSFSRTGLKPLEGIVSDVESGKPKFVALKPNRAVAKTSLFTGKQGRSYTFDGTTNSTGMRTQGKMAVTDDGLFVARSVKRSLQKQSPARFSTLGGSDDVTTDIAGVNRSQEEVSIKLLGVSEATATHINEMSARISSGAVSNLSQATAAKQIEQAKANVDLVSSAKTLIDKLPAVSAVQKDGARHAAMVSGMRALQNSPDKASAANALGAIARDSSRTREQRLTAVTALVSVSDFEATAQNALSKVITDTSLRAKFRREVIMLAGSVVNRQSALVSAVKTVHPSSVPSQKTGDNRSAKNDCQPPNWCWSRGDRVPKNGSLGFEWNAALDFTIANDVASQSSTLHPSFSVAADAKAHLWSDKTKSILNINLSSQKDSTTTINAPSQLPCLGGSCTADTTPTDPTITEALAENGIGVIAHAFRADLQIFNWEVHQGFELPCGVATEDIDLIAKLRGLLFDNEDPVEYTLGFDFPIFAPPPINLGIVEFKVGLFASAGLKVKLVAPFAASAGFCKAGGQVPYYTPEVNLPAGNNGYQPGDPLPESVRSTVLFDASVRLKPELKVNAFVELKLVFGFKKKKNEDDIGGGLGGGLEGTIASADVPANASVSLLLVPDDVSNDRLPKAGSNYVSANKLSDKYSLKVMPCYAVEAGYQLFYDFQAYFFIDFPKFVHDEKIILNTVNLSKQFDKWESNIQGWLNNNWSGAKGTFDGTGLEIKSPTIDLFPGQDWTKKRVKLPRTVCTPFEADSAEIIVLDIDDDDNSSCKTAVADGRSAKSACGSLSKVSLDNKELGDESAPVGVVAEKNYEAGFSFTNDTTEAMYATIGMDHDGRGVEIKSRISSGLSFQCAGATKVDGGLQGPKGYVIEAGQTTTCKSSSWSFKENPTNGARSGWIRAHVTPYQTKDMSVEKGDSIYGPESWLTLDGAGSQGGDSNPQNQSMLLSLSDGNYPSPAPPNTLLDLKFKVNNEGTVDLDDLIVFIDGVEKGSCSKSTIGPNQSSDCKARVASASSEGAHTFNVRVEDPLGTTDTLAVSYNVEIPLPEFSLSRLSVTPRGPVRPGEAAPETIAIVGNEPVSIRGSYELGFTVTNTSSTPGKIIGVTHDPAASGNIIGCINKQLKPNEAINCGIVASAAVGGWDRNVSVIGQRLDGLGSPPTQTANAFYSIETRGEEPPEEEHPEEEEE